MKKAISIIMTSYNRGKKLERAIKSVLNQSFKDWELVIVDDHSTCKKTKEILKKYESNEQINLIRRKKNYGQHTKPKNEGTIAAKYDLIAYLDDDNEYRKDHLQALYKEMERNDVEVVYGDRMVVNESDGRCLPSESLDFSLSKLSKFNFIDTSDVLCKKEAILSCGGWDESLQYYADWNLWVRMAKNGARFLHLPLLITDYYSHAGNNVRKSHKAMEKFSKIALKTKDPQILEKAFDEAIGFSIQNCPIWPDKTTCGERPRLRVAVFSLTYDRLAYTIETIESMREKTKYEFDHFIVDNGSKDKTPIWLADNAEKYNIKYTLNEKNVGISKGSNQALDMIKEAGDYDIIIKIDNDVNFITDGWLETIIDVFHKTNSMIMSPYVEGLRDHPGGTPRIRFGYIGDHYIGMVGHLGGICVAAPARAYEYRWDEEDFLHGEQDWIFSQEMKAQGYPMIYLENVRIEHMDSTAGQEKKYPEYFERRKKEKITKHEEM